MTGVCLFLRTAWAPRSAGRAQRWPSGWVCDRESFRRFIEGVRGAILAHQRHQTTKTKEGIAVNRLFEDWRMPVVCRFLKLSLPAILAVGLACATSPARAQDAHDTPFNAYYSGTIATGDASGPMVPELASGWGGGWFFGDSTAMFRDLLDTSTAPGTFGNGLWIIFQAGGNAILGDYAGERSLPDDNGTSSISGTYTVTEG